jgi:hypothetical protein
VKPITHNEQNRISGSQPQNEENLSNMTPGLHLLGEVRDRCGVKGRDEDYEEKQCHSRPGCKLFSSTLLDADDVGSDCPGFLHSTPRFTASSPLAILGSAILLLHRFIQ